MKKLISVILVLSVFAGLFAIGSSAKGIYFYGDVDGDSSISANDALQVLRHSTQIQTLSERGQAIADVDLSGDINSSDALDILRYSTKIITEFKKDYEKTLKFKNVDSVINSGTYSVKFSTVIEDNDTTLAFTSNGKESAVSTTVKLNLKEMLSEEDLAEAGLLLALVPNGEIPVEIRFYTDKNSKHYLIFTPLRLYCEVEEDAVPSELVEVLFGTENLLDSITEKTSGSNKVTTETYFAEADTKLDYTFTNGTLSRVYLSDSKESYTYDIQEFKSTADTSLLGIPKGYIESAELAEALGY